MSVAKKKQIARGPVKSETRRMEAAVKRANKTVRQVAKARKAAAETEASEKLRKEASKQQPTQKLQLSAAQKKKYTELLTLLHEKITKQINFLATDSLSKTDADEPRDDVTDDFDRDFALTLLTSEHDILFEINQAIQRLTDKTYGRCEQCSTPIGTSRLEAIPFARMCITCQATAEKDKSRYQPFGSTMADATKSAASQTAGGSEE
ncbi:MAG: TraR/DksA C4-type zinc finger protein [bacterium]